ncbi:MAG: beta-ketoacyl-[acyl-carrier-protein] synthase II [Proteobacteria bacterium]|nr:beta-ketoacyl-[acyl-carrier-protein] synthase II [Pseudomonadota bacterium]
MNRPQTVITGLGTISPLGNTTATTWQALISGQCGVGKISHFDATDYPCQIAAEVKNFNPESTGLEAKDLKRTDRFIQLGLAATREALTQAGLLEAKNLPAEQRQRIAVIVGTGIGGLQSVEEAVKTIAEKGPRRVSPFFIPAMLPNLLAGQISILYGLQGANFCPVSACATSAHAIGLAKRMIESGEADIVIAGGAEAAITPSSVAGFAAMRALSTNNENPQQASRPFDAARDGFVMGEGAAVLVLENASHAAQRGAKALATLAGFGQTSDATHMTLASGEGSGRAMQQALNDANLKPATISYINAHATSTPAGDELEAQAIATLFGPQVPTSSTKGATGHLLGAAGSLEAIISIMALQTGILPPTLNSQTNATPLQNIIPNQAKPGANPQSILSNSFGFGGTNASLIFTTSRPPVDIPPRV